MGSEMCIRDRHLFSDLQDRENSSQNSSTFPVDPLPAVALSFCSACTLSPATLSSLESGFRWLAAPTCCYPTQYPPPQLVCPPWLRCQQPHPTNNRPERLRRKPPSMTSVDQDRTWLRAVTIGVRNGDGESGLGVTHIAARPPATLASIALAGHKTEPISRLLYCWPTTTLCS